MTTLNQLQLIGRLGAAPKIHVTDKLCAVNFSVATDDVIVHQAEKETVTEWHQVRLYNGTAKAIAEKRLSLKAGDLVFVQGKIKTQRWQDKEGKECEAKVIIAHQLSVLSSALPKSKANAAATTSPLDAV